MSILLKHPLGVSSQTLDALESGVVANSRGFNAPINIAKAVRASVESPSFQIGLDRERSLFTELSTGTQAPAMQYLFFSERQVSNPPRVTDPAKVPTISKVGVIGGGTMGAGIAMCFAEAGVPSTLVETTSEIAQQARARIERTYKSSSAYKNGKMNDEKVNKLVNMISFTDDMSTLSSVDLVIEAVFENMNVKKEIFKKLDSICKPDAIMASNTSYLSIDEIGSVTSRPNNVIGTRMHPEISTSDNFRLLFSGECYETFGSCQRRKDFVGDYCCLYASGEKN